MRDKSEVDEAQAEHALTSRVGSLVEGYTKLRSWVMLKCELGLAMQCFVLHGHTLDGHSAHICCVGKWQIVVL